MKVCIKFDIDKDAGTVLLIDEGPYRKLFVNYLAVVVKQAVATCIDQCTTLEEFKAFMEQPMNLDS